MKTGIISPGSGARSYPWYDSNNTTSLVTNISYNLCLLELSVALTSPISTVISCLDSSLASRGSIIDMGFSLYHSLRPGLYCCSLWLCSPCAWQNENLPDTILTSFHFYVGGIHPSGHTTTFYAILPLVMIYSFRSSCMVSIVTFELRSSFSLSLQPLAFVRFVIDRTRVYSTSCRTRARLSNSLLLLYGSLTSHWHTRGWCEVSYLFSSFLTPLWHIWRILLQVYVYEFQCVIQYVKYLRE